MNLSNAILKEIATDAVVARKKCVDFDTATESGIYSVYTDALNHPATSTNAKYGILLVFSFNNVVKVQIFFGNNGLVMYHRMFWESWRPWRKIAVENLVESVVGGG